MYQKHANETLKQNHDHLRAGIGAAWRRLRALSARGTAASVEEQEK
jgi:hypothetical protein